MRILPRLLFGLALLSFAGVAAANSDDGFVWIDANTRIRIKPVGTASTGASAPEKAPKKVETKEKPAK